MDNDEVKRPNAKYELSYPDIKPDNNELNFHYNRQRRLDSAPQIVKDLYNEPKQSRFGIIGALIADKPRRTLFIIIILLCLAVLALSRFGYFDTTYTLEGNRIEFRGTIFEGTTIIIINKIIKDKDFYTGAVNIAVSPSILASNTSEDLSQNQIFYHRIFFTAEQEEQYRFVVPFDTAELLVVLQSEKNTLQLRIKPD